MTLRNSLTTNQISNAQGVQAPFQLLRDSGEFRLLFADHVHRHFFNGRAVCRSRQPTVGRGASGTQRARRPLGGDHQRDLRRFAGRVVTVGRPAPDARDTRDVEWQREFEKPMRTWLPQRSGIVLEQYCAAGLIRW